MELCSTMFTLGFCFLFIVFHPFIEKMLWHFAHKTITPCLYCLLIACQVSILKGSMFHWLSSPLSMIDYVIVRQSVMQKKFD